jgi:hypothetical protein
MKVTLSVVAFVVVGCASMLTLSSILSLLMWDTGTTNNNNNNVQAAVTTINNDVQAAVTKCIPPFTHTGFVSQEGN